MWNYRFGVKNLKKNRNSKYVYFDMKGVAIHDKLLGRWTLSDFDRELDGFLPETRLEDRMFLLELLSITGVVAIVLKKKGFIVEKEPDPVGIIIDEKDWSHVVEKTMFVVRNFLDTKTLLRRRAANL